MRLGRSDVWSWLPTVRDKLDEMPSLEELLDGDIELETILGIVPMVSVESTIFIPISLFGRAL